MDRKQIEKNFEFIKDKVFALILFGSFARNEQTEKSDIDICIVVKDKERIKEVWDKILESGLTAKYDIKIFETLPLKLKVEIMRGGKIIWCENEKELDYYFWKYKKLAKQRILLL